MTFQRCIFFINPPTLFIIFFYIFKNLQVKDLLRIHDETCPRKTATKQVQLSCDGVSECKSNAISLDVYSIKMMNCRQVYPYRIVRPIHKGSNEIDHKKNLQYVVDDLLANSCQIKQFLADNLKRAVGKGCLNHASLFPCEYCFARGKRCAAAAPESKQEINDMKLGIINEKIEKLRKEKGNSKELKNLEEIKKDFEKDAKKNNRSHIVWPYSTMRCEPRTTAKIREIVEKIENSDNILPPHERMGVVYRSPLLDIPNFDIVADVPVDYMHAVCLGVGKRLVQLTFNVGGEKRTRNTNRKLSPTTKFNQLMIETKVPREFPRRTRELDLSVMKAAELRNMILFYFPHVLECIESPAKERRLWLLLTFMIRSCILPKEEFQQIPLAEIEYCCDQFYKLYEHLFGERNCTYNTHVVPSHLIEMRNHGPLTETSTFVFESFYGEMRHAFTPGTQSPLKQIFKKILMKRLLAHHSCESSIFFSNHDTALECNSLIYCYVDLKYELYKICSVIDENTLNCLKIKTMRATFTELPARIDWSKLGVFLMDSVTNISKNIKKERVNGKLLLVGKYLITCPNSILREK